MRQLKDLLNNKELVNKADYIRLVKMGNGYDHPEFAGPAKYLDILEHLYGERKVDCFDLFTKNNKVVMNIIII